MISADLLLSAHGVASCYLTKICGTIVLVCGVRELVCVCVCGAVVVSLASLCLSSRQEHALMCSFCLTPLCYRCGDCGLYLQGVKAGRPRDVSTPHRSPPPSITRLSLSICPSMVLRMLV